MPETAGADSLWYYPQEEQRQRIIVSDVVEAGEDFVAPCTKDYSQMKFPEVR